MASTNFFRDDFLAIDGYYKAHGRDAKFIEIENIIFKSKNAEDILNFAIFVSGADLQRCEDKIIELNNPTVICNFAKLVPNANKERLKKIIIDLKMPNIIIYFANVVGYDKELEDAIIALKRPKYCRKFF